MSTIEIALRSLRPATDETLLLRALILSDARGASAWSDFKRIHADLSELFRTDRGELRRLSPLLARNLKSNGADVDSRLWTVLRTALMREDLRARIYQQVLGQVVTVLDSCEIPYAVIRGAAIGALVYPEVAARHSHDIDVLIRDGDIERARIALVSAGFANEAERQNEAGQAEVHSVVHETSLPVRLHSSLFEFTGYALSTAGLLSTRENANLQGVTAPVLSVELMLLQTLVHASYSPTRYTLQWVPDAAKLAARVLNWEQFIDHATTAKTSLVVYAMLSYVADEIENVVPSNVRDRLRKAASRVPSFDRDLALYGARMSARRGVAALFDATPSVIDRVLVAKWLALPSTEYLRWSREVRQNASASGTSGGRSAQIVHRLSRYFRARRAAK